MNIEGRIQEMVEEFISDDLFVIRVLLKGKSTGQKLIVLMDGDNGISIDQCAAISRHLSQQLDEMNLISGAYKLEVSSPGLDHPIASKRQFVKNIGRSLQVETGEEKVSGKLLKVSDNLLLEIKEKKKVSEIEIPLKEVIKANVLVSFK